MSDESYQLKVQGYTVYVKRADDKAGSPYLACNSRQVFATGWGAAAIVKAAGELVALVEADRQAKIDREQAVQEAQRQLREEIRAATVEAQA